jgi:hypothetical protein
VSQLQNRFVSCADHHSWWFTDHAGLWGDAPFLHLGERHWFEEQSLSLEQFHIINLETGELTEYALTDQAYPTDRLVAMLNQAGFGQVEGHPGWGGLDLYDAHEWVVYIAEKGQREVKHLSKNNFPTLD